MADLRAALMAQARSRSGLTYRLDPPPDGVTTTDCSLLIRDSVKAADLGTLPRTAEQQRQATVLIDWDEVKPGDLLFFEKTYDAAGPAGPDGKIASHVGFSLGAGTRRMLDAHERSGPDVAETDISSAFWQDKLIEARRLPGLVAAEPAPPAPPAVNPWQFFTAAQIAQASGCPASAVREHWPRLVEQLAHCDINARAAQIAMIGTVAIESASTFAPVREAFWLSEEWRKANLRYWPFYGRGFIQITWEENYRTFGQKVNELWGARGAIDLVARPDDALDPDVSAAVSALYFRDHGGDGLARIPEAARTGNWAEVRRLVQGGSDGLDRLVSIATALLAIPAPASPPAPVPTPPPAPPVPPIDWRAELGAILARHDANAAIADEIRALLARVPA